MLEAGVSKSVKIRFFGVDVLLPVELDESSIVFGDVIHVFFVSGHGVDSVTVGIEKTDWPGACQSAG